MLQVLAALRKKVAIGFVGGSDLRKITEQLAPSGGTGTSTCIYAGFTVLIMTRNQPSRILTTALPRTA